MPYPSQPLLSILPYKGYQDNEVVQWLSTAVDPDLIAVASRSESFYQTLAPSTATSDVLDYLAPLCGLTGQYWDKTWSLPVKRAMVQNSHTLWRTMGTASCIHLALTTLGIQYKLWTRPQLNIPFKIPKTFNKQALRFIILMPFPTSRTSYQWIEANRALNNFKPVIADGKVCYEKFKVGYSRVGDTIL